MAGLLFTIVLLAVYGVNYFAAHRKPGPYRVAPDFTLSDLNSQAVALSDFRGKVVLLDFWATWCDPCREETPHLIDLQTQHGGQGLQIIGISMDDEVRPVREFQQQFKMNYPVVMGNAKLGELYGGVLGLPVVFLLDRSGRIRSMWSGTLDVNQLDREIRALLSNS